MACIIIEKMNESHIADLARLEKECFSQPWSEDGLRAELNNPNAVFYVAVADGVTAGYVGMHHVVDVCYIANLAVLKEFRKQGIAGSLLQCLCDYAQNSSAAELTLEVRASNDAAIALYKKNGFEVVGKRPNFYKKPTEDAFIMTKNICNC